MEFSRLAVDEAEIEVAEAHDLAGRIRGEADGLLAEFEEAGIGHAVLGRVRRVIEVLRRG